MSDFHLETLPDSAVYYVVGSRYCNALYVLVAVTSSGLLFVKQKLGVNFDSD